MSHTKGMITLHHLNNSRSQRILWLLEELELPYEIRFYQRDSKTMLAPDSLKNIHPLGKSPVITDGPNVVAESAAIIEYIIEKYGKGKLKPSDEKSLLRYRYWLHYAEGSAMLPLFLTLMFNKIENAPMPFFIRPIAKQISQNVKKEFVHPQLHLHLSYINDELKKAAWFAGSELSGADIQMSFPLEAAQARGGFDDRYPNISHFLRKIHSRPAYQRALERGGEYSLLT